MLTESYNPFLRKFATFFLFFFSIQYIPIEGAGISNLKVLLMTVAIFILLTRTLKFSKAFIIGLIYVIFQVLTASFHPESFRSSTLIYSALLVLTYICFYNLVTIERVFTIDYFIKITRLFIKICFIVTIVQQVFTIIGINYFPILNLYLSLNRGLGCNSLFIEPSHFGRFMLIAYYAYIKCSEYRRGEGAFTLKELFNEEHKWVTIRFLWMMITMGSGTAFVGLIFFSLYFVRRHNWYYTIPVLAIAYSLTQFFEIEALDRATNTLEATTTMDTKTIQEADGSASVRIAPIINSINADLTKFETWFGKGIDSGVNIHYMARTLFDDYGLIFYLIGILFNFTCAYNFWSLGTVFMFAGIGGGCGSNIQYAWALIMIMTCVKYFHDNRYNPEIYEEEDNEVEENTQTAIE